MFKFNFSDVELEDDRDGELEPTSQYIGGEVSEQPEENKSEGRNESGHYRELSVDELAKALPPALSYTPLVIPVGEGENRTTVTLLRRDLFDARFQLMAQDNAQDSSKDEQDLPTETSNLSSSKDMGDGKSERDVLSFVDNPFDLVPGVYEGGLKTWECSLDLVESLFNLYPGPKLLGQVKGKRMLEVGCGTAIPSLYLLSELFAKQPQPQPGHEALHSEMVLQDYNELVLRLVTFPNVLLNWCECRIQSPVSSRSLPLTRAPDASPLAESYRETQEAQDSEQEHFNVAEAGEIAVTPELVTTFISSLNDYQISLRFITGSWESMLNTSSSSVEQTIVSQPFDIVLTSETIYRLSSLTTLITLLKTSTLGQDPRDKRVTGTHKSLEDMTGDLTIASRPTCGALCLVAAKVLYFGVGGGIIDFERLVKESHGQLITILERTAGVGRKVMKVSWA